MSAYPSRGLFRPRGSRARRFAVVAATTAALAGAGAAAYAVWTTQGSGTGTSQAATAQPLTTTAAAATTTGLLYPGGTGDVRVTIVNPNPYPVTVTGVVRTPSTSIGAAGGLGACATHDVDFVSQSGSWLVPARAGATNGTATVTLAGAVTMGPLAENGCQGATFTIPVTLTGTSA